jgi:hypothetical protein
MSEVKVDFKVTGDPAKANQIAAAIQKVEKATEEVTRETKEETRAIQEQTRAREKANQERVEEIRNKSRANDEAGKSGDGDGFGAGAAKRAVALGAALIGVNQILRGYAETNATAAAAMDDLDAAAGKLINGLGRLADQAGVIAAVKGLGQVMNVVANAMGAAEAPTDQLADAQQKAAAAAQMQADANKDLSDAIGGVNTATETNLDTLGRRLQLDKELAAADLKRIESLAAVEKAQIQADASLTETEKVRKLAAVDQRVLGEQAAAEVAGTDAAVKVREEEIKILEEKAKALSDLAAKEEEAAEKAKDTSRQRQFLEGDLATQDAIIAEGKTVDNPLVRGGAAISNMIGGDWQDQIKAIEQDVAAAERRKTEVEAQLASLGEQAGGAKERAESAKAAADGAAKELEDRKAQLEVEKQIAEIRKRTAEETAAAGQAVIGIGSESQVTQIAEQQKAEAEREAERMRAEAEKAAADKQAELDGKAADVAGRFGSVSGGRDAAASQAIGQAVAALRDGTTEQELATVAAALQALRSTRDRGLQAVIASLRREVDELKTWAEVNR